MRAIRELDHSGTGAFCLCFCGAGHHGLDERGGNGALGNESACDFHARCFREREMRQRIAVTISLLERRGVRVREEAAQLGIWLSKPLLDEGEQLVQDDELELEFERVDEGVQGTLQGEHVFVVKGREPAVEGDDANLHEHEQPHHAPCVHCVARVEELPRVEDVEARDDGFLQREDGLLHALHDLHGPHEGVFVPGYEAKLEDDDGRVHEHAVGEDHDEYRAQNSRVVDNQVQTGPEDDGEASDVAHPADFADDGCQDWGAAMRELFDQIAGRLKNEAESRNDDGPEVES